MSKIAWDLGPTYSVLPERKWPALWELPIGLFGVYELRESRPGGTTINYAAMTEEAEQQWAAGAIGDAMIERSITFLYTGEVMRG